MADTLIPTGQGTSVNADFISPQGISMANTYAQSQGLPPPVIPSTLNSSNLGSSNPVTLPQTQPPKLYTPPSVSPPSLKDSNGQDIAIWNTGLNGGQGGYRDLATGGEYKPQTANNTPQQDVNNTQTGTSSVTDYIRNKAASLFEQLSGKAEATTNLQNQFQLSDKTTQAAQDYANLQQARVDLNNQLQSIGGSDRDSQVAELSRIGNMKIANLSIISQSSQGLLSAAQQTIKDKLDAQFSPIQDQIDYLTKFAIINNNDLTESEKYKLEQQAAQKKTELADITKVADALHQNMSQNQAPASVYAALDKITNDYVAGKITSTDAQSQMYQSAGQYGVDVNKKLQADKLRSDIAASGSGGGLGSTTTTDSSGKTVTITPQQSIEADASDVLEGKNTLLNIRLSSGRSDKTGEYMRRLRIEIRAKDPNFDFIASDAGGKSVSSSYVQRATASINSVLPNIDKVVQLSNQVSRLGITGVDKLIQLTKFSLNDKPVANFHEAQKLIADEIGVALGAGTVSDMKLQLGFDVTNPSVSQEVFASNMNLVKDFLHNRLDGLNSLRYKSSTTDNTLGTSATSTPSIFNPVTNIDLSGLNFKF